MKRTRSKKSRDTVPLSKNLSGALLTPGVLDADAGVVSSGALSLEVSRAKEPDSSLVEWEETPEYHVPISSKDLMMLCSWIPLSRKGIPCITVIPLP
jgi:hypothetical protein